MATKQSRIQIEINKVLGVNDDGEIIGAQYAFFDTMHDKPFNGVTSATWYPLTQKDIDSRNELEQVIENYGYLWEEAVKSGKTTESQSDYIQNIIDCELNNSDSLFLGHDNSYVYQFKLESNEALKKLFPNAVAFECVGSGRCFPESLNNLKHVFEPELCNQILEIEGIK